MNVIFVLNKRFVPDAEQGCYIYGVVQHVLHLAHLLSSRGTHVGFALYERDESIESPLVSTCSVLERYPAAVLKYNAGLPDVWTTNSMREAIMEAAQPSSTVTDDTSPLIYSQTDALLPYIPAEFDVIITHHSPFVTAVRSKVGDELARKAFEWDHPKADFLHRMQTRAIDIIRTRETIHCLEISCLQEEFLRKSGVSEDRIHRMSPPVGTGQSAGSIPNELQTTLSTHGDSNALIALTAVSRLDQFKNVELFVSGAVKSLQERTLGRAIVVGGETVDPARERLLSMIPSELRERFTFVERLPHAALVGTLFPLLAGRAVFVCTSRYDLVPYTVLEAARSGLCTLVPCSGAVGAAEYFPSDYQFDAHPEGLVRILRRISTSPSLLLQFEETARYISAISSNKTVLDEFDGACSALLGRRDPSWSQERSSSMDGPVLLPAGRRVAGARRPEAGRSRSR